MRASEISKKFSRTRTFKNGVSIKIEKRDLFDRVFRKILLKHEVTKWPYMVLNSAIASVQSLRRRTFQPMSDNLEQVNWHWKSQ